MARKGWDNLKPGYRKRLQSHGITKESYSKGATIKKARGHEKTPERPAARNTSDFRDYKRAQDKLLADVEANKRIQFGGSPKWNDRTSRMTAVKHMPSLADMELAKHMTRGEMIDALRKDAKRWAFLGYKG